MKELTVAGVALWTGVSSAFASADAHGAFARRATEGIFRPEDRGVILTEHPRPDGTRLVCAVNTRDRPVACALKVDGTVTNVWNGRFADGTLSLGANDGCILEVTR